jgi:NAD-dependent dihydropyrimidine dehydrogenase PreA subunit
MADVKKWEEVDNWVEIDLDLCKVAEECVNVCPAEVYIIINGKVNAENIGACIQCGACQDTCPYNAILNHFAW